MAVDFKNMDSFFVENSDGTLTECDILILFEDEYGRFVAFTDGSRNEDGGVRVFAGRYDPAVSENALLPIENEEDMNYIEDILNRTILENKRRARRRDVYGVYNRRYARRFRPLFR